MTKGKRAAAARQVGNGIKARALHIACEAREVSAHGTSRAQRMGCDPTADTARPPGVKCARRIAANIAKLSKLAKPQGGCRDQGGENRA